MKPTDAQLHAFASLLKEMRAARRLSARGLGELIGRSHQTILDWEAQKYGPDSEAIVDRLEDALGAHGELREALGYGAEGTSSERLLSIEKALESLNATLAEMRDQAAMAAANRVRAMQELDRAVALGDEDRARLAAERLRHAQEHEESALHAALTAEVKRAELAAAERPSPSELRIDALSGKIGQLSERDRRVIERMVDEMLDD
jgi:DNA-binding XRE family transcriptional regulator